MNRNEWIHFAALALLVVLAGRLHAQVTDRYAGAYLSLPVHARATGMGSSYTAIAQDAAAAWWNPAGLAFTPCVQITGTYALMSLERMHNYAALAIPSKDGFTLAIHALQFGALEIDGRDAAGVPTELYTAQQYAAGASLAFRLGPFLSLGVTGKYLQQSIASTTVAGYGVDAGIQFDIKEIVYLGGTAQNISGTLKWDTDAKTEEILPVHYRAGVGIRPIPAVVVSMDAIKYESEKEIRYCGGAEWWLTQDILALRAGYVNEQVTAGASLGFKSKGFSFRLDYAYLPDLLQQGATSQISFVTSF